MQGQLFSQDFLLRAVKQTPAYLALDDAQFAANCAALRAIFSELDAHSTLNEAQTESQVINRLLVLLGWGDDTLPQVNTDRKGREAVPDCLLFASSAQKAAAMAESKDERRYRHGLTFLEAKRWLRPLDRGDGQDVFDPDAPSSQMLRERGFQARFLLSGLLQNNLSLIDKGDDEVGMPAYNGGLFNC